MCIQAHQNCADCVPCVFSVRPAALCCWCPPPLPPCRCCSNGWLRCCQWCQTPPPTCCCSSGCACAWPSCQTTCRTSQQQQCGTAQQTYWRACSRHSCQSCAQQQVGVGCCFACTLEGGGGWGGEGRVSESVLDRGTGGRCFLAALLLAAVLHTDVVWLLLHNSEDRTNLLPNVSLSPCCCAVLCSCRHNTQSLRSAA